LSYFLAFAGFAALIILHEFGHFIAAKAVGMRVERFALFFPPLLWKVKRGETEYGIGAIPLGGYVRITGMNPNEELPPEVAPRAYYNQAVWKRIVVIAAGPLMNVLVAFVILFGLFAFKGEPTPDGTVVVASIERGSPAAGRLMTGDRIVSVDGRKGTLNDITTQVSKHTCAGGEQVAGCRAATPTTVRVLRNGHPLDLRLTPVYDAKLKRPRLGFSYGGHVTYVRQGPIGAAGDSVSGMWRVTKATGSALTRLVYDKKAREQVSGVVGSYETTRQTIKQFGFADAMEILAIISLSLAIVNLFPFLPLDGGHIFWAVAEKLRGRAIAFSVMERASVVGFMLVILLFAVGLSNDIGRLRGEGFGLH
jgi:regulator of sigma E protease